MDVEYNVESFIEKFSQNCISVQKKYFKKNQIITTYIQKRNQICILLRGEADLVRYDFNGSKSIIEHYSANDFFGEAFYIVSVNNELSVEAKKNCDVLFFSYDNLFSKCQEGCEFHKVLMDEFSKIMVDKMKSVNIIPILIIISIISIIISKFVGPLYVILISIISILFLFTFIIYQNISLKNRLKKELELNEQKRLLLEKQKNEEIRRILKERNIHIEELKQSGIKKMNLQKRLNTINVATNISIFQKDKIMVTFFGGKLIFYSIDIIKYEFIELLYTKEFSHNTYNAFETKENDNIIIVYGYPGIKILQIEITNLKGKEGNKYKLIQNLKCDEYNNEIIKVLELNKNTLVSISTDYLLIWEKDPKNLEYKKTNKILNFAKYEDLLILSNILKLDTNNIVLLKQANSTMTKSSVNFIEITNNNLKEKKLINIDISPLDTGNNNLIMYDNTSQIFLLGCLNGLAIMSGKYMELIFFIELKQIIKNIDIFFDKYILLYGKFKNNNDKKEYIFFQIEKDKINFDNIEKISKINEFIKEDINTMKYFRDGLVIIGDHDGNLQLWH